MSVSSLLLFSDSRCWDQGVGKVDRPGRVGESCRVHVDALFRDDTCQQDGCTAVDRNGYLKYHG